jgi:hypothetical protein
VTETSTLRRLGPPALAVAVAVAVAGVAGWAAGVRAGDPVTVASARPIPAVSPSVPVFVPYAPDLEYPTLQTHLDFVTRTIGAKPYQWKYAVPKGWMPTDLGINEIRWKPDGEPTGGYFLRVKLISSHVTPTQMVQDKYDALNACCQDVSLIQRQWNTLGVTYREPATNTKRWDIFRWLTSAGSDQAEFEMSVGGRSVDDPGLEDLMTRVSASVTKTS